jgi:hypothetical protein
MSNAKLKRMRLYRSHLVNEVNQLVDQHLANPRATNVRKLVKRVDMIQARVRNMNIEIDKQESIRHNLKDQQREVPAFARA